MLSNNEKMMCGAVAIACGMGTLAYGAGFATEHFKSKDRARKEISTLSDMVYQKDQVIQLMEKYSHDLESKGSSSINPILNKTDVECLALNNFNEAGMYKTAKGTNDWDKIKQDMFLISSSVFNRSKDDSLSICGIIYQKMNGNAQYSWTIDKRFPKDGRIAKVKNPDKWEMAYNVAKAMVSGKTKSLKNVKWYNNPKASNNSWHLSQVGKNKFSPLMTIKDKTTQHVYYVEIGKENEMTQVLNEYLNNKIGKLK